MPDTPSAAAPYVFLSYASAEPERVATIAEQLKLAGLSVWIHCDAWAERAARGRLGAAHRCHAHPPQVIGFPDRAVTADVYPSRGWSWQTWPHL